MEFRQVFERKKAQLAVGLLGFFLLAAGVVMAVGLGLRQEEPEVKILSVDEETEVGSEVVVDVEGAVEKPGLYRLKADARVQDAVTAAGGMAAEADRKWIAKYLNLAQPLVDGSKLYIPIAGENVGDKETSLVGNTNVYGALTSASGGELININSASTNALESLWGIGEARAKAIVEGRPYGSIEELREKKIIPSNVFEEVKDKICVY